jgi:hypothetical protein
MHTAFWCGHPGELNHLEDPGVEGGNNIKTDFEEVGVVLPVSIFSILSSP